MGLSLPNHPHYDELEATANLLINYINILSTEDDKKGTFIKPVCISNNGQSCIQKQHPIAQMLEANINNEITHEYRRDH